MLKYLLEKEFKQIFRSSFMLPLLFVFPFIMMVFLPWAADMEIKNVNIALIDNSHDSYSSNLSEMISASGYFTIIDNPSSYDKALELVEYGDVDIIVEIPSGFEKSIESGETPDILLSVNSVNGTKGGLGASYLMTIVRNFEEQNNARLGYSDNSSEGLSVSYEFNEKLDYKSYMLPVMMVMLLTLLCGFLPAINIVTEKERGTIEQINVTPVNRFSFILAKLIPYWIIGFVVLSLCFGIAALVYGLYPRGSIFTMYLFSMFFLLTVSGIGLIISNYSESIQQAMFVMLFFIIILLLMSGLFTPISSMPVWAQFITYLNPLTYFNVVMRGVYLKGSTVSDLLPQLYALAGFTVVLNVWAVLSYKKRG